MNISYILFFTGMLSLAGVFFILFRGLFAMAKTGENNRQLSNKMMKWRIGFQGMTIAFLFLSWVAS